MNDFEAVALEDLGKVNGGFWPLLMGLFSAAAPLIGRIVDASRKHGGDQKGTQIGDSAGQMFSSLQGMTGDGGQRRQSQDAQDAQDEG